jgi:hypothetical protein
MTIDKEYVGILAFKRLVKESYPDEWQRQREAQKKTEVII